MTDRSPQIVGTGETDVGLRNFMMGTYRYMAAAMAVTAGVAYFGGQFIMSTPRHRHLPVCYSAHGHCSLL